MAVSYDLLYELEAVLMRPRFRRKLAFSDVIEYVIWLRENAELVPTPDVELGGVTPDPDDDHLVGLALAAGARYLVSGNIAHLPPGSGFGYVSFVTPRQFVDVLREAGL